MEDNVAVNVLPRSTAASAAEIVPYPVRVWHFALSNLGVLQRAIVRNPNRCNLRDEDREFAL